jgi:hypothetical protein
MSPLDGAGGIDGPKVAIDMSADVAVDVPADVRVVDAYVPDAQGTCSVASDCPDPSKAFCVAGVCVGCQAGGLDGGANLCSAPTAVCNSVTGKCVGCTASSQCTSSAAPICDLTKNVCVACTADPQCQGKDTTLPACRADGQCVQCNAATAATSCTGTTPACDVATNTCVECTSAANCAGVTPICGTNEKCKVCAGDADCAGLNDPAHAACAAASGACVQCTGTNSTKCAGATAVCNTTLNKCVQCLTNAACTGSTPICATTTNTCRACAADADCASFAGQTACAPTGACVQCKDNSTCAGTTPVCATATNTCRACASDDECAGDPGVCMVDGHCATDAETVYVGTTAAATCASGNTGTSELPLCSAQSGIGLAKSSSKPLVVIRGTLTPASTTIALSHPLTIVGKSGATLAPADLGADAVDITAGEVYLRDLTIKGGNSTGIGINAQPSPGNTVTLHMDTCLVTNNPGGGILLNGAAFDIKNTTVTYNGPGALGVATWGGILVNALPPSGSTSLDLLDINSNNPVGLSCVANIQGVGIHATANTSSQITPSCGIAACSPASATCGAQSTPQ